MKNIKVVIIMAIIFLLFVVLNFLYTKHYSNRENISVNTTDRQLAKSSASIDIPKFTEYKIEELGDDLIKMQDDTDINNILSNYSGLDSFAPISKIKYNDLVSAYDTLSAKEFDNKYKYKTTVNWNGKISGFYSQITGIKFCVIDNDHPNVDINKPCDFFWASSDSFLIDRPDSRPDWDGYWVNYVLGKYAGLDKNQINYENDVYLITGQFNEMDCGVSEEGACIPDIEIISIKKIK